LDRQNKRREAQALWYVGQCKAEIRDESVSPAPNAAASSPADVVIKALYGAISRGTERLVFSGRVPPSEYARMRAPFMAGEFPFPVKYGYATVGRIVSGPEKFVGRVAFALYPHQSAFSLPTDRVVLVPGGVP
jgi:hypothetical protein